MRKLFIITAISDKNNHWCVSGICINDSKHYRLISDDNSIEGAVHKEYLFYKNREKLLPLDLVEFHIIRNHPNFFQPENIVIDQSYPPKRVSKASRIDLKKYLTDYDYVLFNEDRFIDPSAWSLNKNVDRSLELIHVNDLTIYRTEFENKHKLKAYFSYKGIKYKNISITDPKAKKEYFGSDKEKHFIGDGILLISLGEVFRMDGLRYKLIACIH